MMPATAQLYWSGIAPSGWLVWKAVVKGSRVWCLVFESEGCLFASAFVCGVERAEGCSTLAVEAVEAWWIPSPRRYPFVR